MTLTQLPSIHHEPKDFRRYLDATDRAHVVGRPQLSGDCPLSHWLSWLHRQPVAVATNLIVIDSVSYATPVWMADFLRGIDALKGKGSVTARQALAVLEAVCEGEEREAA